MDDPLLLMLSLIMLPSFMPHALEMADGSSPPPAASTEYLMFL